jgi:cell division protein YceG involved in septum cleavage
MTKYSIKNICLGIGIGLVFSSILNISTAPKAFSIEEIRREATKHNLIVMDAKDVIKKQLIQEIPVKTDASNSEKNIEVVINSGCTSEELAETLLNNNLIEDKQAFLNRLNELKKESKVQVGTFEISMGATVDEIIEVITTTPQ